MHPQFALELLHTHSHLALELYICNHNSLLNFTYAPTNCPRASHMHPQFTLELHICIHNCPRALHMQPQFALELYIYATTIHWSTLYNIHNRSLIATFCPLRRKPVDTVDWQVANKIGSLSFYTKMSRRWLILSLKLKGICRWDFLIINTELKRKDGIFMYSRSLEDCNTEFFVS